MTNPLQSFQSRLTSSFSNRVYLLEALIGNRHWLTTGTFKERVLITFLNDTLPKKLRAKSGFIVFPRDVSAKKKHSLTLKWTF